MTKFCLAHVSTRNVVSRHKPSLSLRQLMTDFGRPLFRINRLWCFPWWCFQEFCCRSGLRDSGTGRLNKEDKCKPGTGGLNSNHVIQSGGVGAFPRFGNPSEHLWLPVPVKPECRDLGSVDQLPHHRTCETDQTEQHPENRDPPFWSPREEMSRKIGNQGSPQKGQSETLKMSEIGRRRGFPFFGTCLTSLVLVESGCLLLIVNNSGDFPYGSFPSTYHQFQRSAPKGSLKGFAMSHILRGHVKTWLQTCA